MEMWEVLQRVLNVQLCMAWSYLLLKIYQAVHITHQYVQSCMAWSYLLLEIYQKPCAHITHQYLHHTHMVLVTIGNYRAFMQNPECMNRRMVRKYSRRVFYQMEGCKKGPKFSSHQTVDLFSTIRQYLLVFWYGSSSKIWRLFWRFAVQWDFNWLKICWTYK